MLLDSISQYYLGAVTIPPHPEELSASAPLITMRGPVFIHFYAPTTLNIILPSYTVALSVLPLYTPILPGQRSMLTFSWQQTISPRQHNKSGDSRFLSRYHSSDLRASWPWSHAEHCSTWLWIDISLTVTTKVWTTKLNTTRLTGARSEEQSFRAKNGKFVLRVMLKKRPGSP